MRNCYLGANPNDDHMCDQINQYFKGSVMIKEAYTAPELVALGSFETITQGGSSTGALDSQFPVGTPSTTNVFS